MTCSMLAAGVRYSPLRDEGFPGKDAGRVIVIQLADHACTLQRPSNGAVAVAGRKDHERRIGMGPPT